MKTRDGSAELIGLSFPNTYMEMPFHDAQLAAGTCEGQ